MHLLLDGHGPLYAQLTRALKGAMSSGLVARGMRLPPTRVLAEELGISRNTVLAAYEQLRAEGYVDGRVGSGSYARAPISVRAANDPGPVPLGPQSAFAQRVRLHRPPASPIDAGFPGHGPKAMRYSFQYGLPLVDPTLTTTWSRELARAAKYASPNYPSPLGLLSLREAISDYLARRRGVRAKPDNILIVNGTQQAIALTARLLIDPGDPVAIEDPHYLALRRVLQMHGAELHGVPVDADGLCCDQLPRCAPRLICVTPSHQFPTGAVMSHARRMQLLDYAKQCGSWIFEDDYDSEYRHGAQPIPALRSLDANGRVIYVGTFSKTLFPALRLGYVVMPPALRQDMMWAKWAEDFGCASIEQAAMAHFMASGAYERHLRRSAKIIRERRRVLMDELHACSDGRMQISASSAGMHLVVWLHDMTHAALDQAIARARDRGLGIHPIAPYFMHPPDSAGLLLGYCEMSIKEIRHAVRILARCLDEVDAKRVLERRRCAEAALAAPAGNLTLPERSAGIPGDP